MALCSLTATPPNAVASPCPPSSPNASQVVQTVRSAQRGEGALEPLVEPHRGLPAEFLARAGRVERDVLYLALAWRGVLGLEVVATADPPQRVHDLEHAGRPLGADVVGADGLSVLD